ncbi:MAG: ribosomal RNA small subunit methyltransferase A [Clostridia bacterium]|nr:ribosomal RNA small subunit methyltransferase A [Clostridia bacterium]
MIDSKKLIKEYALTANKALGQNFLVDENALQTIIGLCECAGKNVLEIGPGLGALTNELINTAKKVVCVEIDAVMCGLLKKTLSGADNLEIINMDILKVRNDELTALLGSGFVVCANLPYYITTDIAMKLIDSALSPSSMTLMMQQEAAAHFLASPKQKCYTPVSVIAKQYFDISEELRLSPSSYYPEPTVHSSVLVFKRNARSFDPAFSRLVKAAFSMRRKTLRNNLASLFDKALVPSIIEHAGLAPSCRAEELSSEDFTRLLETANAALSA